MKIAITGANGFVGRNLIKSIQQNAIDTEIIAVVRNSNSLDTDTKVNPTLKIIQLDIHNPPSDTFEKIGAPDVLIHLAWDGLPNYNSLHHFETELPKQYEFLSSLIRDGLKSLFITGTCFEYGMQSGELDEKMEFNPDNPYGFAKNSLRKQLEYLQREVCFNLTWARLFYIYGDNQTGNSIFPQLKKAVKNGDTTFNMSKGEQLRDYLDIKQVANYIFRLALLEKNIGSINICSGTPISIRRLVEKWIDINSWDIKLNLGYYPYPTYEPLAFWGNNSKLETYMVINP